MSGVRMLLVVACALVDADRRVLLAQRPEGKQMAGLWEFPGGKIEPGETEQETLAREINEELGVAIEVGEHIVTTSYDYDFGTVNLSTYYCALEGSTPTAREHSELRWVEPRQLLSLDWAPADVEAVNLVVARLG